ncbi:hypothetical protein [Enterovirga rhinocerotis]|uniref:Uncharacterized protein n=1 Tax=Enterovirga rhinocerotis TaxID=1339210 RepID=A0A4R7BJ63_9HYPH|nr:hypothetical protein [Enterovirga rhinocerotis]TDR85400.1 hypothetical protein EV668_4521 [Enterovirga rhinocerotis]
MSVDPIAAVGEDQATGETAELFADLRATLGVPFVNLIWRHLATIPGALPAVWTRMRPLYLSDELGGRAEDLRQAARVPGIETLSEAMWDCAGVDAAARARIGALIDDYNRANSTNFLALATAGILLRGENGRASAPRLPTPAAVRIAAVGVPPLPALDGMPPSLGRLVRDFDQLGRLGANEAIASLYRHLAHWPAFMAVAYAALLPHDRAGLLQTAQRALVAEGRGIAAGELLPMLAPGPIELDAASRARALASIDDFTGLMIGRMTVMGMAMRTLLGR